MIVCQCAVVTDHEVHDAMHAGAGSICDLAETCGVAEECGGCLPELRAELREHGLPTDEQLTLEAIREIVEVRRQHRTLVTSTS